MHKRESFKIKRILTASIVLSLMFSFSVSHAQDWHDAAWEYRKALIIDHTYVGVPLNDFPFLVDVTLDSGAQPDGDDILFTDYTGTTLTHEIERYDDATGNLVAWVKIPSLSSTENTIVYLYYGNPAAANQENPAAVWDSNYVMVHHLEETADTHNDSTSYANHGTPSVTTQGSAPGRINGADEFDGVDDYVDCGNAASLDITGSMTVEAWVLSNGGSGANRILAKDRTSVPGKFILWRNSAGNLAFIVGDANSNWYRAIGAPITDGEWIYAVGVYDAATQTVSLYKNGVRVTETNGPPAMQSNAATALTIGAAEDNAQNWIGTIDEVRISNQARSAEWISASYDNVNSPGSFYVIGIEEMEGVNTPPMISSASPVDGSTDVPISLTEVGFTVMDSQNDLLNYAVSMTPDLIGGIHTDQDISSGTAITIPIVGGPLDYDTAYTWDVAVHDPDGSGTFILHNYDFTTESPPPPPPAFSWWSISDPHLQTDLPGYRSLEAAILDSTYGGDQGGESFYWDIATVAGDWTGQVCPSNSDGQDLIDQWIGGEADPNYFYGVTGNHDGGETDNWWFEKWIDPLGLNTAFSLVDNNARPYPVEGAWDHYSFTVGNLLYLMLSDRNEGPPPFGRLCSAGYPSGRMSLETYNWWVQQVEAHPDHIIITISHQALFETTIYTGFDEGYEQGVHGGHSWADRRASSMIYTIDNWTIDGLDENETYIGERNFGFEKYLQDHPGAIDLWIHGHTHHNMYPGITFNGRSEIETKHGVTFINTGALTKYHGGPQAPYSRLFSFYDNSSTVRMQTYMHTSAWAGAPEGFYEPAEVLIELDKTFDPGYQATVCEGDLDCDEDVDGSDAQIFKADFGRNEFQDPCTAVNPCSADFDCDGDADGSDAQTFKLDFGRGPFSDPCPACTGEEGCIYQQ